jgi:hypothetical protein
MIPVQHNKSMSNATEEERDGKKEQPFEFLLALFEIKFSSVSISTLSYDLKYTTFFFSNGL